MPKPPDAVPVRSSDVPLGSQKVWTVPIPGNMAHVVIPSPQTGCVYVSDGWGVAYSATRFHRYDLGTGTETASVRTGTAVRCMALLLGGRELLAATDTKLLRLDARSLEERERWTTRVPRFLNSLAVRDDVVVGADWISPKVNLIDLGDGRARRRAAPAMPIVLDAPGGPLVVGGQAGKVVAVDAKTGRTREVLSTPPALDADLGDDGRTLWLLDGVRATVHDNGTRLGAPTRILRRYALDGGPSEAFRLNDPARTVVVDRGTVWSHDGRRLTALALPLVDHVARTWTAPSEEEIVGIGRDAALVFTVGPRSGTTGTTPLSCYRLGV